MAKKAVKKTKKVEKDVVSSVDTVTVNYSIRMSVSFQSLGYDVGMTSAIKPGEDADAAFERVEEKVSDFCSHMDDNFLSEERILEVVAKKGELEARAKRGR